MRWRGRRESENVEDRRGIPAGGLVAGGGIGTLILVLLYLFLGGDPQALIQQQGKNGPPVAGGPAQGPGAARRPVNPAEEERASFSKVVFADTEDVWTDLFQRNGKTYQKPTLVLYSGVDRSGCGTADASVGPFYCPADSKVYLDLSFFKDLSTRFKAPGEFAQAYVIAHEVGHHVQNLLGTNRRVEAQRRAASKAEANALSVRLELQADFYAGVWAHHAQKMKNILEPGDVEAALDAATAIGDDTLQKNARGYAVPDSFTHGTSAQRARWFRKGLETGDVRQGDTFNADRL